MALHARTSLKLLHNTQSAVPALSLSGQSKPLRRARPLVKCRHATQGSLGNSNASSRKQVTIATDDGHVRWGDLSIREKAARSTQQSVNFVVIAVGMLMTGGVFYVLYREVFASESKTSQFNRAFDQVRKDRRCVELLGSSKKMKAYGEPTWNKWSRVRPIASNLEKDRFGTQHLRMHFNVEGPQNKGVISLHMTKSSSQSEFEYKYLALDVKGHERVYLEHAEDSKSNKGKMKMFGVNWGDAARQSTTTIRRAVSRVKTSQVFVVDHRAFTGIPKASRLPGISPLSNIAGLGDDASNYKYKLRPALVNIGSMKGLKSFSRKGVRYPLIRGALHHRP